MRRQPEDPRGQHFNALLHGVRRVNRLITRERSPERLLRRSAELLVEARGLVSATILLHDPFGLRVGAAAGSPRRAARFAAMVSGGAPPSCVLRASAGETVVIDEPVASCADCVGADVAGVHHSAVCLPLECEGRHLGVLHAVLPRGVSADAEAVGLLAELGADVAFALRSIELERQVDRTRESLQTVHEHLSALVETSPTAIVSFDADGCVTGWNQGAVRLFGWTAAEALGRAAPFGDPTKAADAREFLARVLAGDLRFPMEVVRARKDGREVHVSLSAVALRSPDGAPRGLMCLFEDVTGRRRAEQALRESAEQYRIEFEHAPAGRCVSTPDGRILRVNPALAAMLGHPAEAFLGHAVEEYIHPDDLAVSRALGMRLLEGKQDSFRHEMRFVRADGSAVWTDISAALYRGADGAPVTFITDLSDLTARKEAEDRLQRSEERYRNLIESLDDLVYAVDVDGRLTYVSGAISLYRFRPEEVIGHRFQEFVHPDDREALGRAFAERLAADVGPYEFRLFDGEGKVRSVRSSGRRVFEGGRLTGLAGVLIDLTAQRSTEEQLRAAQKMEAVGRLAGGVAHDFNNILTVINSYAGLAARGLGQDDPRRAELAEIRRAGDRATALTRQLLAFSRRQVLKPEVIEVAALVAGIERMLARLIGEDVELRVSAAPGAGRIRADPGQVEQVLMNLAVNARDAMPDGGRLLIETANAELDAEFVATHRGASAGPFVRLRVTDTGCGMDPATRERLFEPFFTTKPVGKGTGLGLATVYGIIKQSGGSIWVASEPGKGATFDVYFPRVDAPTSPRPDGRELVPAQRGSACLLFVEDDEAIRTLAVRVLADEGYEVLAAGTGGEALLLAERNGPRIDLVLTDVVMPGMSGKELAGRLRPALADTPILFMSGYTHDAISRQGALEPGTLFLAKPFTPESLVEAVRAILERRR